MRVVSLFLFLTYSFLSNAQFRDTPNRFVLHLLNNKMYDEAILVLNEKLNYAVSQPQRDSMNFLLGKTYYTLQQLPQSIEKFDLVTDTTASFYAEAKFFSAFNEAYLNKYELAEKKLSSMKSNNLQWNQLKTFEQAGVALLQSKFIRFDSLKNQFTDEWPIISQQQKNFTSYKESLTEINHKSVFVAGALSALLPGAGKFYAGKKGNGIYTLLISSLLGAQAYEAYRKDGIKSVRFIIYGSLFTSFYVGNIWGSALAVKIVRDEKRDAIHHQVLFDMHIPLRTIFQ